MDEAPELWDVYLVSKTRYTDPPKDKFVVIITLEPQVYGCLINSRINRFVLDRPHLLPCMVLITESENPFLSYDSFLDVREVFMFSPWELSDYRGRLSPLTIDIVLKGVADCPVLKDYYKLLICGDTPSDDDSDE